MNILLAYSRVGVLLAVFAIVFGCLRVGDQILYCDLDDQSWNERDGAMHIDLERRLIYGGDTSSAIYPFAYDDFAGFDSEFPLLLVGDSVDPSEIQGDIVAEDVVFRFFPVEGSFGDLWLITAKPKDAESQHAARQRSSVLYSKADGVLWIGFSYSLGEKIFPVNYTPCGRRTLRYEDLRRATAAQG